MNIVILGAGRVGLYLAKQLIEEDKMVTLVEKDSEVAKHAANHLDCIVLNEEGNSLESLRKAGTEHADFFISVTESDELNLLACGLVSGEFRKPVTIARVRNFYYSTAGMWENPLFGIHHIINPEIEAAREISNVLQHGVISNVMLLENGSMQIRNFRIDERFPFVNSTLQSLRSSIDAEFLVPFIHRNGEYMIPAGGSRILQDDEIYILSSEEGFNSIYPYFNVRKNDLKKIAIVGGGNIACHIADDLTAGPAEPDTLLRKLLKKFSRSRSRSVHFIEKDYNRCKYLTERYPNAIVSHVDISDEGFLEEGSLKGYDILISTTGNQEMNIITALYAKKQGVEKVIALVQKMAYKTMTQELGIDVCVSMNNATANSILKLVRRGNIQSLHTFSSSNYEIIEFTVETASPIVNRKISGLKLPKESLVLLVIRDGTTIIPYGELEIHAGDNVVLISNRTGTRKIELLMTEA